MKLWQLLVMGMAVHGILFYSIFDMYFTTPLVHCMTPVSARGKPPAKRLVLFMGDGLRADTLFQLNDDGKPNAPFMRHIIEQKGAWGISHARGPTESRPCLVALLSGFFEDISAVTKMWKKNPVPFDSVFNESRHTWGWGNGMVMELFKTGARAGSMTTSHFSGDYRDEDYKLMDSWVFENVPEFFAKNDSLLRQDKLVFFVHLASCDGSGQTNLPLSRKYAETVSNLDDGVRNLTEMIEDFYKDGSTTYILTADHGMGNMGYHGSDSPQETRTPLVAWGAGVRGPEAVEQCGDYDDGFCQEWRLSHRSRVDVQQIDVAPLMAYLIGVPYPVNSRGELPVSYLGVSDEQKAEAMYTNAQQIIAQLLVKIARVKNRTISATFWPFRFKRLPKSSQLEQTQKMSGEKLSLMNQPETSEPIYLLRNIRNLMDKRLYKEAISESQYVIRTGVEALRYYHTYDRLFLGSSVTLSFLGWMGIVALSLLSPACGRQGTAPHEARVRKSKTVIYVLFGVTGATVTALLYMQSLPWTYYWYGLLPVLLWLKVALRFREAQNITRKVLEHQRLRSVLCGIIITAVGLLFIVHCFSHREQLSLGLVLMAVWVLTTPVFATHRMLCLCWMTSCAVVAIFPLLPVAQRNVNYFMVLLCGVVAVSVGARLTLRISRSQPRDIVNTVSKNIHFIQLILVAISTLVVGLIHLHIDFGIYLRKTSWCILGTSFLFPLLTGLSTETRLFSLGLACLAPYILMSVTYESLFMLSFMCLLYFWLRIECQLAVHHTQEEADLQMSFGSSQPVLGRKETGSANRSLRMDDLRLVGFYLFFVLVAFFATQTMPSIDRFYPDAFETFQHTNKLYVMDELVFLKIGLPFVVVTLVLKAVQVTTRLPLRELGMVIILMSEFTALVLFFLVRDFGTWQQVGQSITYYVICLCLAAAVVLMLTVVAGVLTSLPVLPLVLWLGARIRGRPQNLK